MTDGDNNPIGYLQELCQKHGYRFPQYEDVGCSGPDHCREFTVRCSFEGLEALGKSRQKKQAKSESARAIVTLLKERNMPILKSSPVNGTVVMSENNISSASKNPISAIYEYCQANKVALPRYVESLIHGNEFICECHVLHHKTYGQGSNKKTAKTEAALKMCLQLNIACVGKDLVEESNTNEDNEFSKNCISLLQEKGFKNIEYTDLPPLMGLFRVRCTINSISCEGSGTTKKNAKHEAAKKMLLALPNQSSILPLPNQSSNEGGLPVLRHSETLNTNVKKMYVRPSERTYELEDFNLSDEEEQKKEKTVVDLDVTLGLEELSLGSKHELREKSEEMSKGKIYRKNANLKNSMIKTNKSFMPTTEQTSVSWNVPAGVIVKSIHLNVTHHANYNLSFSSHSNSTPRESSSSRTHKTKTSESLARWAGQDENPS